MQDLQAAAPVLLPCFVEIEDVTKELVLAVCMRSQPVSWPMLDEAELQRVGDRLLEDRSDALSVLGSHDVRDEVAPHGRDVIVEHDTACHNRSRCVAIPLPVRSVACIATRKPLHREGVRKLVRSLFGEQLPGLCAQPPVWVLVRLPPCPCIKHWHLGSLLIGWSAGLEGPEGTRRDRVHMQRRTH